jgi:hypothetical protein
MVFESLFRRDNQAPTKKTKEKRVKVKERKQVPRRNKVMAVDWYYVDGDQRVGPVSENEVFALMDEGKLNSDSYVWKKGFDNWEKIKNVEDFQAQEAPVPAPPVEAAPPVQEEEQEATPEGGFDWNGIPEEEKIFNLKIGLDRGDSNTVYGPYSVAQLRKLAEEKRCSAKTYIFATGMENWSFLGDTPLFHTLFPNESPQIADEDRRVHNRRPFVARLFFHDDAIVYEGVCRDISVGGLQVLMSDFPGNVGDKMSMNVHPENSDYSFVASGTIVRVLDGRQGFSLRFENLNEDAQRAIDSYVRSGE